MIERTAAELAAITGGQLFNCNGDIFVTKIVNNDKLSEKNCAYIAINGENHKGIEFAKSACKNGASLIICEDMPKEPLPVLLVSNSREALCDIAAYYRKKERKTVVAITGSVGKTTTKELCHAVLSQRSAVHKTEGNKNNTVGLPLTLLSDNDAKTVVLEAGISEVGEMSVLSRVAAPDIAVITGVGLMHAQTLGTSEITAREKLKILEFASPECTLIAPHDASLLLGRYKNTVTVSTDSDTANYCAKSIAFTENGSFFDISKDGRPYIDNAFVPIIGRHGVLDALFAVAVGDMLGVNQNDIKIGLCRYKCPENRQNIIVKNGLTVISDCYNFGPESARASLAAFSVLAEKKNVKKTVLMLGSMLELGVDSERLHIELGKELADMHFDALITVGTLAKNIALGALMRGMNEVYDFSDEERDKAGDKLKELAVCGSGILIKGSRKTKMEEFIPLII